MSAPRPSSLTEHITPEEVQSRQAQGDVAAQGQERNRKLKGGEYSEADALKLLNSIFFIGQTESDIGIYRTNEDGSATFLPEKDFKLLLANVTVTRSSGSPINGAKFWLTHPRRSERKIVFNPHQTRPGEHNLWRGFAVEPAEGWDKQWRLLRHIYKVICRRGRQKFFYLMRRMGGPTPR